VQTIWFGLDRARKGKKLSNEEWTSKTDPEAKIAKLKDGRTHLAYKPEHAVDLDRRHRRGGTASGRSRRHNEDRGHVDDGGEKPGHVVTRIAIFVRTPFMSL
jgi:hypothetical protein